MQIKQIKCRFLRGIFDQNTYVISEGNEAVIIDAGAEVEDIINAVEGKKVLAVLITHLHFDHIWNIEDYVRKFNCKVYISYDFFDMFADYKRNASFLIKSNLSFRVSRDSIMYYDDKLDVGNFHFDIYSTPGHTEDSVCILCENCLFTGDTVFCDSVGRTDLVDGNKMKMRTSLRTIDGIDFENAYPGHGYICDKDEISSVIKRYLAI